MIKLLIKKQLFEQFKSCFINQKTLKKRSRKSTIGMIILYVSILLMLSFSFFFFAQGMVSLLDGEYAWLYYAFLGSLAIVLGTVSSAVNAHASLYKPKDNDLLLSMPIKPKDILISRLFVLYVLGFIYSACVWLPTMLVPIVEGYTSLISVIISVIVLFINPVFVAGLSAIFGYLIALISNAFKNKSSIVSIFSLLFLGVYLYGSTQIENGIENILLKKAEVGTFYKIWLYPLYAMGKGCTGSILNLLIYVLICFTLFALVVYILSINYTKIIVKGSETTAIKKKVIFSKQSSIKATLLRKEFKHFISSSTYTVNCGFGILFVIGFMVFVLIKAPEVNSIIDLLKQEGVAITKDIIPIAIVCVISSLTSTCFISTPSLSLEGKRMWIYKSLPISFKDITEAKQTLHILLVGIPSVICSIVISKCLNVDFTTTMYVATLVFLVVCFDAIFGLVVGIINPNLNWSSEVIVIKQGINVLISMLVGVIVPIIIGFAYYLTMNKVTIGNFFYFAVIVLLVVITVLRRWLDRKGSILFNKLN